MLEHAMKITGWKKYHMRKNGIETYIGRYKDIKYQIRKIKKGRAIKVPGGPPCSDEEYRWLTGYYPNREPLTYFVFDCIYSLTVWQNTTRIGEWNGNKIKLLYQMVNAQYKDLRK